MVGAGADLFAKDAGLEIVDPKYYWTKERRMACNKPLRKIQPKQF